MARNRSGAWLCYHCAYPDNWSSGQCYQGAAADVKSAARIPSLLPPALLAPLQRGQRSLDHDVIGEDVILAATRDDAFDDHPAGVAPGRAGRF